MKKIVLAVTVLVLGIHFVLPAQDLYPKKNSKNKYGYVDKRDTMVIPYQFQDAEDFYDGLAAIKLEGKWGFIDKTGKIILSPQYELVYHFTDGLCPVRKSNKWFYINKKGRKAIDENYEMAYSFSEGLAAVKTAEGWGYIEKNGSWAIKGEYEEAYTFSEGLANVKDAGFWGYINTQGETVIEFKFDEASPFHKGLATVKMNGKNFQIERNGKKYTPPKEEKLEDPNMVYTAVDQRPDFPGGQKEYLNFLQKNMQYPAEEKQLKKEGLVIISFVVKKDGSLYDFKVIQGDNENFKKEALRIAGLMPNWTPGILEGKPVNVQTTIPVRFRLVTK